MVSDNNTHNSNSSNDNNHNNNNNNYSSFHWPLTGPYHAEGGTST